MRTDNLDMFNDTMSVLKKEYHRVRGCLIGGAAGDALGYAVEFFTEYQIFNKYGKSGIAEYELTGGRALISDDTQMTLFTADGILAGDTGQGREGAKVAPRTNVAHAYLSWLMTQTSDMKTVSRCERFSPEGARSRLLDISELYERRAPGNTCLSALEIRKRLGVKEECNEDFIRNPINKSKGCGGIMRIAPLALRYRIGENCNTDIRELDMEAAQLAAITHGHSLGYMPAAVLSHILSRILTVHGRMSLKDIVIEARDTVASIFEGDRHLKELVDIIDRAVLLSGQKDGDDLHNIHALGEGWVAEETLAIAVYCALKYEQDFSKAIITAVNHNGDSDSTGAVTGNILGAWLGYDKIDPKWTKDLELRDVILEIADELCRG